MILVKLCLQNNLKLSPSKAYPAGNLDIDSTSNRRRNFDIEKAMKKRKNILMLVKNFDVRCRYFNSGLFGVEKALKNLCRNFIQLL